MRDVLQWQYPVIPHSIDASPYNNVSMAEENAFGAITARVPTKQEYGCHS